MMEKNSYKADNLSVKKLTQSMDYICKSITRIIDFYIENNKPTTPSFHEKILKYKYFGTLFLACVAFAGYWINSRAIITAKRIADGEQRIISEQILKERLDDALNTARIEVMNQRDLCGDSKVTPAQKRVEIRKTLTKVLTFGTGTLYTFNSNVQLDIQMFLKQTINMDNLCELDQSQLTSDLDKLYFSINKNIEVTINEEKLKLNVLKEMDIFETLFANLSNAKP